MENQRQGLTPEQLLERHFNLTKEIEAMDCRIVRCKDDMRVVDELISARQIEVGAVNRLLQKQAEEKAKADAEDKKQAEAKAKAESDEKAKAEDEKTAEGDEKTEPEAGEEG